MSTPVDVGSAPRLREALQLRDTAVPSGPALAETVTSVNGPAGAAILAAGIGCFAVGLFALIGDAFPAAARFFTFYLPTGPLSGVTTSAIIVWLASWYGFARRWRTETLAMAKVNLAAFTFLVLGLLLTFPPFMDLLQGK